MRRSLSIALAGAAAAAGYLLLARRAAKGTARSDLAARALVRRHLPAVAMPLGTAGSAVGHPAMYHVASWAAWRWLRAEEVDGAWLVPAAALATWASYRVTKLFVARDRPPGDHTRDMDASYPSGHTSGTTAVTLTVAQLLARSGKVAPGRLLPFVVGVPLVVGASRVLVDEHWASDVAGGWLLGAAVTALTVPLAGARGALRAVRPDEPGNTSCGGSLASEVCPCPRDPGPALLRMRPAPATRRTTPRAPSTPSGASCVRSGSRSRIRARARG